MSQGQRANRSGKAAEAAIENYLTSYLGVPVSQFPAWRDNGASVPHLVRNVPHVNTYGRQSFSEFVLHLADGLSVRIESKHQSSQGSTDEKLPNVLANAIAVEERRVLIVLSGVGWRQELVEWLKDNAHAYKAKRIEVLVTTDAVADWARNLADEVSA